MKPPRTRTRLHLPAPLRAARLPACSIALLLGCLLAYLVVEYLPREWLAALWPSRAAMAQPMAGQSRNPPQDPRPFPGMTVMGDFNGIHDALPDASEAGESSLTPRLKIISPPTDLIRPRRSRSAADRLFERSW